MSLVVRWRSEVDTWTAPSGVLSFFVLKGSSVATYTSNKKILKRWDSGSMDGMGPVGVQVFRLRVKLAQQNFYRSPEGNGVLPCELFAIVANCRALPRRQPRSRIKRHGNYGIFRK